MSKLFVSNPLQKKAVDPCPILQPPKVSFEHLEYEVATFREITSDIHL